MSDLLTLFVDPRHNGSIAFIIKARKIQPLILPFSVISLAWISEFYIKGIWKERERIKTP